jgi:serine acetyltransferase
MNYFRKLVLLFKNFGLAGVVRKIIFVLASKLSLHAFRKIYFFLNTGVWVHKVMKGTKIKGIGYQVAIGKDATFYNNSILEINQFSHLNIGNHFVLSYGALIACHKKISIGDFVMIGEYTSIRDTTHSFKEDDIPFMKQKDESYPVTIGNNVWIGRGCIIMPGSEIGDNVIIGANSVVKGQLKEGYIYAGTPAKMIRPINLGEVRST